jgi:hypothetical protein
MSVELWLEKTRKAIEHNCFYSNKELGVSEAIMLAQHRDSDTLTRSNWIVITESLKDIEGWHIERFNHWAVGWIEYLVVNVNSAAFDLMVDWNEKLDDYPIADEDHYFELEFTELHEFIESEVSYERRYNEHFVETDESDSDIAYRIMREINVNSYNELRIDDLNKAYIELGIIENVE